jgi:RNA polymerase sigma-70 factor (ECF subfamily)
MILIESRELLDAFRRGDKPALHRVYEHYVADVSRFLMRGFTFDSQGRNCAFRGFRGGYEIEAALQEVFRRAFEERARLAYDGLRPYRPYLLRIARNLVINDLKAKQPILFRFRSGRPVILEPPPQDDPESEPAPTGTPEEIAEAREVHELVLAFKEQLDAREQGVFAVRFEEGLSAERAGEKLGLTRSQIRTTETKLRARFLSFMQSRGYLGHYRSSDAGVDQGVAAAMLVMALGGFA